MAPSVNDPATTSIVSAPAGGVADEVESRRRIVRARTRSRSSSSNRCRSARGSRVIGSADASADIKDAIPRRLSATRRHARVIASFNPVAGDEHKPDATDPRANVLIISMIPRPSIRFRHDAGYLLHGRSPHEEHALCRLDTAGVSSSHGQSHRRSNDSAA